MSIAVLIAVEEYAAEDIKGVRFSRNDAEQFQEALAAIGFDEAGRQSLISEAATKANIELTLRTAISSLTAGDTFYLYYAGHGFCEGASNFLTCHDTRTADLVATSIGLEWVFGLLRAAGCQKIVVFLDSCHSGLLVDDEVHAAFGDRDDGELREFFDHAEHGVCFASCQSGQVSWGSRRNKHGAWTFNVIEALRGNVPTALENGTSLSSGSLQDHLASAVQKTLRRDFVERRDQTPWVCGSISHEFLLAEFGKVLQSRKAAAGPNASQVARLSFCGETRAYIKKLSGFKKHQRVPTEASSYAETFARNASGEEIREDLESVYRQLRDEFGLRRKDLEKVGPEDGGGSVICPYFTYTVHVAQNPDDPSGVIFYREISDIIESERILADDFRNVFSGMFGALKFSPPVRVDLEEFIDRMEEMREHLQSLDFDPDGTYCKLRLDGIDAVLKVTTTEISLVHDTSKEPRVLIETFFESQRFLVDTHDVQLITFDSSAKP